MKNFLLALLLVLPAALFAQQANYTGIWKIDKSRTEFGNAPDYILAHTLEVTQTKEQLTIKRKSTDAQQAQHDYTESLAFNGLVTETHIDYSGIDRKAKISQSDDPKVLVIYSESFKDGAPANRITENWSLTDNGKTLVVERKTEQANGMIYTIKGYYIKQ